MTPCDPVEVYQRFWGTYCLHLQRSWLSPTRLQGVTRLNQRSLHTTNIFKRLSPQWRHNCTSTCLPHSIWHIDPYIIRKGKGKVRPWTGYHRPKVIDGRLDNATPWLLFPRERPGTHCIGDCVDPRAGMNGCGKFPIHLDSIPGPSSP